MVLSCQTAHGCKCARQLTIPVGAIDGVDQRAKGNGPWRQGQAALLLQLAAGAVDKALAKLEVPARQRVRVQSVGVASAVPGNPLAQQDAAGMVGTAHKHAQPNARPRCRERGRRGGWPCGMGAEGGLREHGVHQRLHHGMQTAAQVGQRVGIAVWRHMHKHRRRLLAVHGQIKRVFAEKQPGVLRG